MIDVMAILFWVFALTAAGGALLVVVTPHIVYAAVGLIVALSAVAGLFFLAGAEFLGAMQIMIYVGGTVVLLAFGVMLTARLAFLRMKTTADQWVVALLLAAPLAVMLLQAVWSFTHEWSPPSHGEGGRPPSSAELGLALVGVRTGPDGQLNIPGEDAISGYLLPFELISVHLLVVMIGAAYLARREARGKLQKGTTGEGLKTGNDAHPATQEVVSQP